MRESISNNLFALFELLMIDPASRVGSNRRSSEDILSNCKKALKQKYHYEDGKDSRDFDISIRVVEFEAERSRIFNVFAGILCTGLFKGDKCIKLEDVSYYHITPGNLRTMLTMSCMDKTQDSVSGAVAMLGAELNSCREPFYRDLGTAFYLCYELGLRDLAGILANILILGFI